MQLITPPPASFPPLAYMYDQEFEPGQHSRFLLILNRRIKFYKVHLASQAFKLPPVEMTLCSEF